MKLNLPEYSEIPDVGLFLEQVQRYVSGCFEEIPTISITGSMISNYVKQSIISKPVKKQYYREQIADVIFVAAAKSVLSLDNIRLVIELSKKNYSPQDAYEYFKEHLTAEIAAVFGDMSVKPAAAEKDDYTMLMDNIAVTVARKVYLEDVFDRMKESEPQEE